MTLIVSIISGGERVDAFSGNGVKSEINVTPLVDVVLVLLIIFMVVTPMMVSQGIQLPRAKNGDTIRDNSGHRTISMTASGMLFFDQEPVSEEVLVLRLKALQQKSPMTQVILKADMGASYGAVHHILDLASGAGFRDLALQAQPSAQK